MKRLDSLVALVLCVCTFSMGVLWGIAYGTSRTEREWVDRLPQCYAVVHFSDPCVGAPQK